MIDHLDMIDGRLVNLRSSRSRGRPLRLIWTRKTVRMVIERFYILKQNTAVIAKRERIPEDVVEEIIHSAREGTDTFAANCRHDTLRGIRPHER